MIVVGGAASLLVCASALPTPATVAPATTARPCTSVRRDIAASDDPETTRNEFAERYTTEHLTSGIAAAEGYVDEVIPPSDTRRRLIEALSTLDGIAHPAIGVRNIPL